MFSVFQTCHQSSVLLYICPYLSINSVSICSFQAFGAFWYLFSVERKASCVQIRCNSHPYCSRMNNNSSFERSCINDVCSGTASNVTTALDYGIFDDALNSGVVSSTDFIWKFSYCCWWGLQNLRSVFKSLCLMYLFSIPTLRLHI